MRLEYRFPQYHCWCPTCRPAMYAHRSFVLSEYKWPVKRRLTLYWHMLRKFLCI